MGEASFSYEVDDGVVTWDLREFVQADPADLQEFLEALIEVSDRPSVAAIVVRMPDAGAIGGDMLDTIAEYNQYFQNLPVERVALVSADVKNLAVKSRLDVEDVEVEALDDLGSATEWARRSGPET